MRAVGHRSLTGGPMTSSVSEASPVRPALKPAGAAAGQKVQTDRRSRAAGPAGTIYYGTIEYRKVLLNVFRTPQGWRVAVTKTAYPFGELHATADESLDAAIEQAKGWADGSEVRDRTCR